MHRPGFRTIQRTAPVVAALAQILAMTALLQPHAMAAPAGTVPPYDVGAGELLWKTPSGFVPLPVMDVRVSLRVTGIMVRGGFEGAVFERVVIPMHVQKHFLAIGVRQT